MNSATINQVNEVLGRYVSGNVNGLGYQVPSEETELCKIAYKYRTDKCEKVKHPFTHFYYDLLSFQQKSIRKVLEIGVGLKKRHSSEDNKTGASLYMWHEFLPNAEVFGADKDPNTMFRDGKIKTFLCDQSNTDDLRGLIKVTGGNIDLVIDDASHDPALQVLTCQTLMPLLKDDVIYIIEDVKDLSIETMLRNYNTTLISLRRSDGTRYADDKLLIVRNSKAWSA